MTTKLTKAVSAAFATSTAVGLVQLISLSALAQLPSLPSTNGTANRSNDTSNSPPNAVSTAQTDRSHAVPPHSPPAEYQPPITEKPEPENSDADTIVVTGTHIRGALAAGANVDIYDSKDIERSGYATVQEFISALPQNFQGGGGSEDFSEGGLTGSNVLGGSSVNLRGLGSDSTLVLINGRRPPTSGLRSDFVDISTIPQTAIARIEILPDGASALYGSDAVGGVVNFILRKDFDGAETRLRYGLATDGNVDEVRVAQALGRSWEGGHFLVGYEFYRREHLKYTDRSFTSTFDLRPIGGLDRRYITSNPGNILDLFTLMPVYAIPKNQDGRSLTSDQLLPGITNFQDVHPSATLLPRQKRHSAYFTAEQSITDTLIVFAEARYSERKALSVSRPVSSNLIVPDSNPFFIDPLGYGFTIVAYSFEPDFGPSKNNSRVRSGNLTSGFRLDMDRWQWETYASYSEERSLNKYNFPDFFALNEALADTNPETAFNPFGHGSVNNPHTIDVILQDARMKPRSRLVDIKSVADGPIFSINDRDVSMAAGFEYMWNDHKYHLTFDNELIENRQLSRDIYAVFAEISIPVVNYYNNIPFIHSLDFSVAGRYDDYSDFGSTTNPKLGTTWMPSEFVAFKATYGTSFRAPNLVERLSTNNNSTIFAIQDPLSPTGFSNILYLSGTSPDVESENAKTWTFGIDIQPPFIEELSVEINFFRTKYKNRIASIDDLETALALDFYYPGLINRAPSANELSQICGEPAFDGDPAMCTPQFVDVIVDARTQNMAVSKVKGLDFNIEWASEIRDTSISIGANATYIIDYILQVTKESPSRDLVNTVNNPIDFRGRGYTSLSRNGLAGTIIFNYTDSYTNDRMLPRQKIDSHFTVDLTASVRFDRNLKIGANGPISLHLSAINLFENNPPVTDGGFAAYDSSNFDPLGRIISAEFRVIW